MALIRAFLSHTGVDKDFVDAVAGSLGRLSCIFDKDSFHNGDDLIKVITERLEQTDLFVLFASRRALSAPWVTFELDEALLLKIGRRLTTALVICLDSDLNVKDFPSWLQRSLIRFFPSAETAAREIRSHLDRLTSAQMPTKFVGRNRELSDCEAALGVVGKKPPQIICLFGLDGIGRRTLCQRIATDMLQLRRTVMIGINAADSLADVAFRLRADLEPPSTPARLRSLQEALHLDETNNRSKVLTSIGASLRSMIDLGEFPTFLDEGGILDEDGSYTALADELLSSISSDRKIYAAIIARRRTPDQLNNGSPTPCVSVRPLDSTEVARLLALLLRNSEHQISAGQIESVARRVNGYPPSAYYATRLIERYGADVVDRNQKLLEEFHVSSFILYLEQQKTINDDHKGVLSLLASYSPLPATVISEVIKCTAVKCAQLLAELIDLSLVLPREQGLYSIANPVEPAVRRVFGVGHVPHDSVASCLQRYLEGASEQDRHIVLCEHVFTSATLSNSTGHSWAIRLARDLHMLAVKLYHERNFPRSLEFSRIVVKERPHDTEARRYLVRGLIQNELFEEAKAESLYFRKKGLPRDYYFFSGFSERKQQRPLSAITEYERARKAGLVGVAVFRELALCYFLTQNIAKAKECIDLAAEKDPSNKYLVDLRLQIALAQRDLKTAESLIDFQEFIDRKSIALFRRSIVKYMQGNIDLALSFARKSVDAADREDGRPTFEMWAQLAKCLVDHRDYAEASGILHRIDRIFNTRKDVRNGLWCKWHIAQGQWEDAMLRWDGLAQQNRPVQLVMRRQMLEGYLKRSSIAAKRRDELEAELAVIIAELAKTDDEGLRISQVGEGSFPD